MNTVLNFLAHGALHASSWAIVAYTLIVTHITIIGVTVYLHRCQAHRALDLHPAASHFFRGWLWLTTGMVTGEWTAIHRKHHAKCETDEDPHSPQTLGISKVLWEGVELYRQAAKNTETLRKYGHGTPDDWLERNVYAKYTMLGISLMLVVNIALFGVIGLSIWAIQMVWIPFWAAGVINGLGHFWGYRNFDCADASTNLVPWGILIGGEELHNNHHTYATSAKLSNKWYEVDIGWGYIRLLEICGLAKVKKVAPSPKLLRDKVSADVETLHAVLANRYEVMMRYGKMLKRAYRKDLARLKIAGAREAYEVAKKARKWIHHDEAGWHEQQKQQLPLLLESSKSLKMCFELRAELAALWERSHATRDQLLAQLQNWCERAEASGVKALQEFAARLRCYV